jgi:hypothetical protein
VLLVFEFGDDPGRCNFISNGADRRDIVTLFKEMIARFRRIATSTRSNSGPRTSCISCDCTMPVTVSSGRERFLSS